MPIRPGRAHGVDGEKSGGSPFRVARGLMGPSRRGLMDCENQQKSHEEKLIVQEST